MTWCIPVSVIVPARNEVDNIEACVRSILATAYRPLEVIVVDDRSTDGTAAIVERMEGVRLVRGAELSSGWFGKQWALVQGYRVARGELLLFVDADTRQHPELIGRAVGVLTTERVALVSVISRQEMVTFWERLVQPHVFVALAARVGDLRRINRTRVEWDAIANGQFILTTRAAYETVGTHQAVKESVVDDMALAQAYVRHHLDIFLTHGEQYMVTRMYRSLAGIVEGWTKNLATGVPLAFPPIPLVRAGRASCHVAAGPAVDRAAVGLDGVRVVVGGCHDAVLTCDLGCRVLGGRCPALVCAALPVRRGCRGVDHDAVGVARIEAGAVAGSGLHAAGLKHRRMIPPLQQVVQHLVLHQLAVVAPPIGEVDRVRRLPPAIAAAFISGTGIVHARHLVPFHAIELVEAAEQQREGKPYLGLPSETLQKYTVAVNDNP